MLNFENLLNGLLHTVYSLITVLIRQTFHTNVLLGIDCWRPLATATASIQRIVNWFHGIVNLRIILLGYVQGHAVMLTCFRCCQKHVKIMLKHDLRQPRMLFSQLHRSILSLRPPYHLNRYACPTSRMLNTLSIMWNSPCDAPIHINSC